jgi:hypothetical protein
MSLLGIIETLRSNLKSVVLGCWIVLALVVAGDIARVLTTEEHEAAAATEHVAAPAGEHAVAPAAEHAGHTAAAASLATDEPSAGFHEEAAPAHGFWASAYHIAENVPVFWTAFGFLGCVLLVVVSKSYGYAGVSEREDYYSE